MFGPSLLTLSGRPIDWDLYNSRCPKCNPQSAQGLALPNMQNRFRRSTLELRGPKNGLKLSPRSSRG
eukprot:7761285-Alexandrium_andersonii.AAC.1